jgi:hypothetical protein
MQLPPALRKNAIWLIVKMKDNYLDLIKSDMGVSKSIVRNTALDAGLKERDLRLSQLFARIINSEMVRLNGDIFDFDDCDGPDCKGESDSGFFSAFKTGAKKLGKAITLEPKQDSRDLQLGVLESRMDMLGRQLESVLALQQGPQPPRGPLMRSSHPGPQRRSSVDADGVPARSSSVAETGSDEPDSQKRRRPTRVASYIMKPMSPSMSSSSKASSVPAPHPTSSQGTANEFTIIPVLSEDDTRRHNELLEELKRANRLNEALQAAHQQSQVADDDAHSTSSVLSGIAENASVCSDRSFASYNE